MDCEKERFFFFCLIISGVSWFLKSSASLALSSWQLSLVLLVNFPRLSLSLSLSSFSLFFSSKQNPFQNFCFFLQRFHKSSHLDEGKGMNGATATDSEADISEYVEVDPTGRYGRVCSENLMFCVT